MAKTSVQPPLIPTTPEELMAMSQQPQEPKSPLHQTVGQLPKKGATPVPQALQGPQGELLTGMPTAPVAGPETPVPIELKGAQGELLTQQQQQPAAVAPPAKGIQTPSVPAAPAVGPVSGPTGAPTATVEEAAEAEAQKPGAPDWLKKLGAVAKNTGRGILELIAAFGQGYTGMEGPTPTEARMERETREKLAANEQAFAEKLQQMQQEWQAAQASARSQEELSMMREQIQARAAQAEADRQAGAQQAEADRASQERIAGIRSSGAMPGEDPAFAWFRERGYGLGGGQ